jgi:divalent metal cation (Fe/Co/Zn/Cd) transporter
MAVGTAESARLWSWAVNWAQLFIKLAVAVLSNSKAVYAALAGGSFSLSTALILSSHMLHNVALFQIPSWIFYHS